MSNITLKERISNKVKADFVKLTNEETFKKELSFALQHINKNSQLKKATAESNMQAVLNIAQTGLTLNPVLKLAYLVPRSVRKDGQFVVETHLEPSYMGLCKLVTDSGSCKSIYAHPVYEGDEFEVSLGTSVEITHKPNYSVVGKRDLINFYAVAILHDGTKHVEVMTKAQIEEIRDRSESYKAFKAGRVKSCVWESDYSEMGRKTVIRRLIKYLPKTEIWDKLGQAISLDEVDYKATHGQIELIEQLLLTAAIPQEEKDWIERELNTMSADRAREVIDYAKESQVNPIHAGNNYSQTDMKEKQSFNMDRANHGT